MWRAGPPIKRPLLRSHFYRDSNPEHVQVTTRLQIRREGGEALGRRNEGRIPRLVTYHHDGLGTGALFTSVRSVGAPATGIGEILYGGWLVRSAPSIPHAPMERACRASG